MEEDDRVGSRVSSNLGKVCSNFCEFAIARKFQNQTKIQTFIIQNFKTFFFILELVILCVKMLEDFMFCVCIISANDDLFVCLVPIRVINTRAVTTLSSSASLRLTARRGGTSQLPLPSILRQVSAPMRIRIRSDVEPHLLVLRPPPISSHGSSSVVAHLQKL